MLFCHLFFLFGTSESFELSLVVTNWGKLFQGNNFIISKAKLKKEINKRNIF